MTNKFKTDELGMLSATLFMEKDENKRVSSEVTKKIRAFFEKASDNGTTLEGVPLIDCGITLFHQIKNGVPLKMESLYTVYEWSSEEVRGGWGKFKVNLPKEEITIFQEYLNDIFKAPQLYRHNPATKNQNEQIKRKYFISNILDQKSGLNKSVFLVHVFENGSYVIKFVEMTNQKDSQVFELKTFDIRSFDIYEWRNLKV